MPNNSFQLFPNDFNIGKDCSGRISDDAGNSRNFYDFGHLLSLRAKTKGRLISVTPITGGGVTLYETIWEGGELDFRYTRARQNIEFFTLQTMENYFNYNFRPNFSALWQVINKDLSLDTMTASAGKLDPARCDLGDFSGAKEVEQMLAFTFGRMKLVGPTAPAPGAPGLSF